MDKDGTKSGFDINLLKNVGLSVTVPNANYNGLLKYSDWVIIEGGASSVLAASVFHFGEFKIKDVKRYLADKNIPVRI